MLSSRHVALVVYSVSLFGCHGESDVLGHEDATVDGSPASCDLTCDSGEALQYTCYPAGGQSCGALERCIDGSWVRLDQECPIAYGYGSYACDTPVGSCPMKNPDPACTGYNSWCCGGQCPPEAGPDVRSGGADADN